MAQIDDRWSRIIAAATRPPELQAPRQVALQDALGAGASITADSVGCSVTEFVDGRFHTPAASSPLALRLDLAQYDAGDGPCVAACRDGQVHSIVVMADQPGYTGFTAAAAAHDVRSSLSLPLTRTGRPSALNLYASSTSAFEDPHARRVAELLARCVAAVLPPAAPPDVPRGDDGLRSPDATAATARELVLRARDILQRRDGLESEQAFRRLAQTSRDQQRSIFAVAHDVVRDAEGDHR